MAKKKVTSSQPMLFDVPSVKKEYGDSTKKIEKDEVDISNMGLNAVWEGRSKVFKSFSHYIKNQANETK